MSRRGIFALAAAALGMSLMATTGGAAELGASAAPPSGAPTAYTQKRRTWYRGHGVSAQTNHTREHTHARENARRVRQNARNVAKRAAKGVA